LHNSAEHSSFRATSSFEVQLICGVSVSAAPSLVIAVNLEPVAEVPFDATDSVMFMLLSATANYSSVLATRAPVMLPIPDGLPFLTINSENVFGALEYNGSLTYPPCNPNVTVIVMRNSIKVPRNIQIGVRQATDSTLKTVRPRQTRFTETRVTSVLVEQSSAKNTQLVPLYTPQPITFVNDTVFVRLSNFRNVNMEIVIICLTCFCAVLVAYICVLLLARFKILDLPTWLGGLARRVEWWENPKSSRVVVNSDEDNDEQLDEANNDEEGEDEGDEGSMSVDHEMQSK
jgi:hypothetical protein